MLLKQLPPLQRGVEDFTLRKTKRAKGYLYEEIKLWVFFKFFFREIKEQNRWQGGGGELNWARLGRHKTVRFTGLT